jgi:hypothetical protein
MPISTRANMPILTFNHIFPNKGGLEKLEKIVPKRKSISEEFHNFQNTQENDVQIVAQFEAKKKQPWKKVTFKK